MEILGIPLENIYFLCFQHTKTLKTIRFPVVFYVFESLRRVEDGEVPSRKVGEVKKPGKPLENIYVLMLLYENTWNAIGKHIVSLFLT